MSTRLPALAGLLLVGSAGYCVAADSSSDQIPESARAPVAVADAFQAALVAGDIERAARYLDPAVVILESGGAERSREEYLAAHASADAQFLKSAKIVPGTRSASVAGGVAWIASETRFEFEREGKPVTVDGAETMVLRQEGSAWKIVHIHWSSRTRT